MSKFRQARKIRGERDSQTFGVRFQGWLPHFLRHLPSWLFGFDSRIVSTLQWFDRSQSLTRLTNCGPTIVNTNKLDYVSRFPDDIGTRLILFF